MPKDLEERRAQCLDWIGRQSPTASPHASDNEDGGPTVEGRDSAATSLLEMAGNSLEQDDDESVGWVSGEDADEYGFYTPL